VKLAKQAEKQGQNAVAQYQQQIQAIKTK